MSETMRDVARAIDAMRRGWPIVFGHGDRSLSLLAIESADPQRFAAFASDGRADVLLSPERAATLNLVNQGEAATGAVRIGAVPWLDFDAAMALADPATDLAYPLRGPFRAVAVGDLRAAAAALELARLAGLLPAFFIGAIPAPDAVQVDPGSIAAYRAPDRIAIAARAKLPTRFAERCEIVAFRSPEEAVEHVALVVGAPNGRTPLVRLHSECLTGDALGSLKCDCGPQLDLALERIATEGWGILLYLRQEGRGIGLVNKLRAYALQDQGFDTVDANTRLGFAVDVRDFGVAARMLAALGHPRIRLLSNNPAKVAALQAAGCEIVERVGHSIAANPHNHDYLATKRDRTGHRL